MWSFTAGIATPHFTPRRIWALTGVTLAFGFWLAPPTFAEADALPDLERAYGFADGALSGVAVFSPSAMQFAALTTDGIVRLMQPSGTVLRTLSPRGARLTTIAFSPDGKYLLGGDDAGEVRVWDLQSGKARTVAHRAGRRIEYVGWLSGPDRGIVIFDTHEASGGDGKAEPNGTVLDLATGEALWTFSAVVRAGLGTLHPARDGKRVAALGLPDTHGAACLLDGANGSIASRLSHDGYPKGWLSVALSPDGSTLATGQARDIVLWNVSTGKPKGILKGHEGWVTAFAFSPDGRTLASGSRDGTARLWDLNRLAPVGKIRFDSGARIASVSFSPDGSLLLASTWADFILARVPNAEG